VARLLEATKKQKRCKRVIELIIVNLIGALFFTVVGWFIPILFE